MGGVSDQHPRSAYALLPAAISPRKDLHSLAVRTTTGLAPAGDPSPELSPGYSRGPGLSVHHGRGCVVVLSSRFLAACNSSQDHQPDGYEASYHHHQQHLFRGHNRPPFATVGLL